MSIATMKLNNELNGVELYFSNKPTRDVLDYLKGFGFRYSPKKICWYAKQNEKTLRVAEEMSNNSVPTIAVEPKQKQVKTTKKVASLFDRVQFKEISADTIEYNYKVVGSNYTGLSVKDTAKEIRKHLKSQFPEVKFSVTSDRSSIDITIKQSPYTYQTLEYSPELTNYQYRQFEKENNKELNAIIEYCKQLANSYNYDDSDSMTDYFNTHFYEDVKISYDYEQIEQTEQVKKDIEDFRNKLIEIEKVEEERKQVEFEEWKKEQGLKEIENQKRIAEEKKQVEFIYNSVEVVTLEEDNQYFVLGSEFAKLNKNNTLEEYKEEVKNGDYDIQNVKITKEIHFKDVQALKYFSNMLLHDFDFLAETGGSHTDDERINSITDYYNMTREEKDTVKWLRCGVVIYLNDELQFIVDAQGYNYARYVGLVDNAIIEKTHNSEPTIAAEELEELKHQADILEDVSFNVIESNNLIGTWNNDNWQQYKELFIEELNNKNIKFNKSIVQQIPEDMEECKVAMYKVLNEVDKLQYQFKKANIKQGQKLTICRMSSMGMMGISHITVEEVQPSTYAQYDDVIKLTCKQKDKKGLFESYLYKDMLIYDGWHELPDELFYETFKEGNGFTVTRTLFRSCDTKHYDVIISYLKNKNIKPIINTYKPIF